MPPSLSPLPIDPHLPAVTGALSEARAVVLVAPPGAGKTTRVPGAVLAAGLAGERDIVVVEPRRLAARMAAARVAAELGEPVGRTVGYEVRFDRRVSGDTRIRFVTEGVLTRQLLSDPRLARVGAVVIDEFHERHLAADLALAMVRRLQEGTRKDLALAVMSATFDPAPVAAFLGGCPIVESHGRAYPVELEYEPQPSDRPLEARVAGAVRALVREGLAGDVLVFLPGAAEIRRAREALTEIAERHRLLVVALHGDLPADEQDRALARADRPKVILSTNVAETSVTIEGVVAVVDSGLARVARHSPWSGIRSLRVEPISKASADQRAGRAGRTGPGRCLRLYTRHDYEGRRDYDRPEVERADLAEAALELHAAGVARLDDFPWYEAPPGPALAAAEELLARLGAVDDRGAVTDIGRRMLRFPVHPRQARMLVEAEARGVAREGCALAALAGQRDLRLERRTASIHRPGAPAASMSGPSDLLDDLDQFRDAARGGLRADRLRGRGLDAGAAFAVDRVRKQLERLADTSRDRRLAAEDEERALLVATLSGYPDRVARRRRRGAAELVFAGGGGGALAPTSVVLEAELLVAVDAEERGRGGGRQVTVRSASAVEPDWLLDLYLDRIRETDELVWNERAHRVERVTRMLYDDLVLDEQRDPEAARRDPERAAEILARAALSAGIERFVDAEALTRWRHRLAFVAAQAPHAGITPPSDGDLTRALAAACLGYVAFAELDGAGLMRAIAELLTAEQRALVERLAPEHVTLPRRRRVPVHYEADRDPWIASRLQDFFGLKETPAIAGGAKPLVLHLLAPNQRAVQVTTDLPNFWTTHYPGLRKTLMRRYPRHDWPERP